VTGLSPLDRSFDRFLYATVLERDELPVSVLSTFARQGLDPWQEANRLAALSRDQAAHSLAETILRCGSTASPGAASEAALRLVELLPLEREVPIPHGAEDPVSLWLIVGILMFMIAISNTNNLRPKTDQRDDLQMVTKEQAVRAPLDMRLAANSSENGGPATKGLNR
jgi:hypothetical protein